MAFTCVICQFSWFFSNTYISRGREINMRFLMHEYRFPQEILLHGEQASEKKKKKYIKRQENSYQ